MLKPSEHMGSVMTYSVQPPSGGCVLKQPNKKQDSHDQAPAAFRRLCVETKPERLTDAGSGPSRLQAAVC